MNTKEGELDNFEKYTCESLKLSVTEIKKYNKRSGFKKENKERNERNPLTNIYVKHKNQTAT